MSFTVPGYNNRLNCQALAAKISERQCVINQLEAQDRSQIGFGILEVGWLYPCLTCARGRGIAGKYPEVEYQGLEPKDYDGERDAMIPIKQFYRPDEVAKMLAITRRTVYRMIHDGRLPGIKWGNGPWRIPRKALEPFLTEAP